MLLAGEVAGPFRWLCSTGCMLRFFHSSSCHASVKCCGGPPWAAACAQLWGHIFLCRVKVHTVRVFQWPSWRALASQNLLGSGFLTRHTGAYLDVILSESKKPSKHKTGFYMGVLIQKNRPTPPPLVMASDRSLSSASPSSRAPHGIHHIFDV